MEQELEELRQRVAELEGVVGMMVQTMAESQGGGGSMAAPFFPVGGTGGGDAEPDDKSLDDNGGSGTDEGKLELKNWKVRDSSALSATTLSADLLAGNNPGSDQLVVRDTNGNLKYKDIGVLSIASSQWVVTGVEFTQRNDDYVLRIHKKKLGVSNGSITLVDSYHEDIETTPYTGQT